MAVDVGSAVGYLDLDITSFLTSLKTAQSEAESASNSVSAKFESSFTKLGTTLTTAGKTLTKTVTLPIVGIGTAAVVATSNFDSAMSKVSAISGATGSALDSLRNKAEEMGAKTKFSATESAEAFTYMAMAGWNTEDMLEGIDGIMALSAADGLDLATTSDIVTDALTAFGLSAKDSSHFADVLAKASSSANTNVSMLGESFKYAAPVAGALKYSVEDVAVALGLMANSGIKGSQAGTVLRTSISRLVNPVGEAVDIIDRYGISITNADGTMKSFSEVMVMLREKFGGLTEAEQAQAASMLFGQEAMSGMLAIINTSDEDFDRLTDSISNADGTAQKMADTMLNNLSGQLTLLKSNLEGLGIQVGEIVIPYLLKFIDKLQELVTKFKNLDEDTKKSILRFAAFTAAAGPVLLILGKLATAIVSISKAFQVLKIASLFTNPIGLAVAAVAAFAAVLVTLQSKLYSNTTEAENFKKANEGLIKSINESASSWEALQKAQSDSLAANLSQIANVSTLKKELDGIVDVNGKVKTGYEERAATITGILSDALGTEITLTDGVIENYSELTGQIDELIEKKKAQAILDSQYTEYVEAISKKAEAEQNFNALKEKILEADRKIVEAHNAQDSGALAEWMGIKYSYEYELGALGDTIAGYSNSIIVYEDNLAKATMGDYENMSTSVADYKGDLQDGAKNVEKTLQDMIDTEKRKLDKMKSQYALSGNEIYLQMIEDQERLIWAMSSYTDEAYNAGVSVANNYSEGIRSGVHNAAAAGAEVAMAAMAAFQNNIGALSEASQSVVSTSAGLGYVGYSGVSNTSSNVSRSRTESNQNSGQGDTFIFYSNDSINEVEAARIMRHTKQDMAEGF